MSRRRSIRRDLRDIVNYETGFARTIAWIVAGCYVETIPESTL